MKLSVVIPLFNEETVVSTTCKRLLGHLEELIGKRLIDDYEIIFVDDGSSDNSSSILKALAKESQKIKAMSFSRNFGHQPALVAGLVHSTGDAVVTLDADLQDPPELIEKMIEKYRLGNDIVYAARRSRHSDTFFKRWTARFFYRMMKIMGVDIIYDHADYRLISKKVVEAFRNIREVNIFLRGIFPYMGFRHDIISVVSQRC